MKILLSYSVPHFDPAKKPEEQKYWGSSASILARALYKILSEFGEVTYTDGDRFKHLAGREFDLFVGIENHFSDILDACKVKKSIFWAVNMHPTERNRMLLDFVRREKISEKAIGDLDLVDAKKISTSLRRADYILCIGDVGTYNSYIKHGIPKSKIKILNYGVGKAVTADPSLEVPRFLHVSSDFGLRKGFDLVSDIFIRAQEAGLDFHLDLVGSSRNPFYEKKVRLLKKKLGRKLTYHGWVDSAGPKYQRILAKAHYHVFPTLEDAQAGTVLDTLRFGVVPILSAKVGIEFSPLGVLELQKHSARNLEIIRRAVGLSESASRRLREKTLEYYREFHEDFEPNLREALSGCIKDELYPKVSVILPIFNKEKTILPLLRLLDRACRAYGNTELRIFFDGCVDRSEQITRRFFLHRRDYSVHFSVTPNIFEVKTNNLGLKAATGKYCIILQDDIFIYDRDAFLEAVLFLEKNPTAAILGLLAGVNYYPRGTELRGLGQISAGPDEYYWRQDERTDPTLKQKIFEVDACMRGPLFIRKDFLEQHGYLDEIYAPMHQDDMDLCFRTRRFGKKVYCFLSDVENKSLTIAHYDKEKSSFWEENARKHINIFYKRWKPSKEKDYLWIHRTTLAKPYREVFCNRARAALSGVLKRASAYLPREKAQLLDLLKGLVKKPIKRLVGLVGLEIHSKPRPGEDVVVVSPTAPRDKWLRNLGIETVLDIGANVGQFAEEISRILPGVGVISFEPLADCYDQLVERGKQLPRFKAYNIALGEHKGEERIYRSEFSPSSSLLPMGETHKRAFPYTARNKLEKIRVERLDDIRGLDIRGGLLVKMDVQGFEDRVILGGKKTISKARALIIEVSFKDRLYEGQASFSRIHDLLKDLGFSYRGNWWQVVDPKDNAPLQADAIFVRNSLADLWESGR